MKPTDDESVFNIALTFLWITRNDEQLTREIISNKVDIVLDLDSRWKSHIDREAFVNRPERIVSYWPKDRAEPLIHK